MENTNMNHKELRNMEQLLAMLGDLVEKFLDNRSAELAEAKCTKAGKNVLVHIVVVVFVSAGLGNGADVGFQPVFGPI